MPELEHSAKMLADACVADDRDRAEPVVFDLDLKISRLGHMPPDVFDVIIGLLQQIDPKTSAIYVLLVNLFRQRWSALTSYQRRQVLDVLRPHTIPLEFFEAQQAILELCSGKYVS